MSAERDAGRDAERDAGRSVMPRTMPAPAAARDVIIEVLAEAYALAARQRGERVGDGDAQTRAATYFDYAAGATPLARQGWIGLWYRHASPAGEP